MPDIAHEIREGIGHVTGFPDGIAAGFTTRTADAKRTRGVPIGRWLAQALGAPAAEVARTRQTHGKNVLELASRAIPGGTRLAGEADALITSAPGRLLIVESADCVPILIAAANAPFVAAVHAGWRGTADRILDAVLDRLATHGIEPADLLVFLGPAIGIDRYEVGPEVADVLKTSYRTLPGAAEAVRPGEGDRSFVDLASLHRALLLGRGVKPERISPNGLCTATNQELFPSYRRDGRGAGRMLSGILLRP